MRESRFSIISHLSDPFQPLLNPSLLRNSFSSHQIDASDNTRLVLPWNLAAAGSSFQDRSLGQLRFKSPKSNLIQKLPSRSKCSYPSHSRKTIIPTASKNPSHSLNKLFLLSQNILLAASKITITASNIRKYILKLRETMSLWGQDLSVPLIYLYHSHKRNITVTL